MQNVINTLAQQLFSQLAGHEILLLSYRGEQSDFVRFNRSKIRQAGAVEQHVLTLDLIQRRGQDLHHALAEVNLSGMPDYDQQMLSQQLAELRELCALVPPDPHLLFATEVHNSEQIQQGCIAPPDELLDAVLATPQQRRADLVGILASGTLYDVFCNSLGQQNWHQSESFNLDWSFYHSADKAVKSRYAGLNWDRAELDRRMTQALTQLEQLAQPARTLTPGSYRAYLAPSALEELTDLLSWGGFGLRSYRQGASPLARLVEDKTRLHPQINLSERAANTVAPGFQETGFVKPDTVALIEHGAFRQHLVSPRSEREYRIPNTGADNAEMPQALSMAGGELASSEVLDCLDTGLYISNLWYCNYSDRNAGRITGMTRFATFWVEHGQLREPVNVMRFDDTIYNLLGQELLALTRERELLLDAGSYEHRSRRSSELPGLVVKNLRFTL